MDDPSLAALGPEADQSGFAGLRMKPLPQDSLEQCFGRVCGLVGGPVPVQASGTITPGWKQAVVDTTLAVAAEVLQFGFARQSQIVIR